MIPPLSWQVPAIIYLHRPHCRWQNQVYLRYRLPEVWNTTPCRPAPNVGALCGHGHGLWRYIHAVTRVLTHGVSDDTTEGMKAFAHISRAVIQQIAHTVIKAEHGCRPGWLKTVSFHLAHRKCVWCYRPVYVFLSLSIRLAWPGYFSVSVGCTAKWRNQNKRSAERKLDKLTLNRFTRWLLDGITGFAVIKLPYRDIEFL